MPQTNAVQFRALPIEIKLSDNTEGQPTLPKRVQILRTGKFYHPQYGEFEITKETILKLKENFDAKVRGVDVAIDFSHESDKEAAAWITALELGGEDGSELWADVAWTKSGADKVGSKEYRYLSADFSQNFKNNESLQAYGPTLMGAGLTNRPVIKGMAPVLELSELTKTKETAMDPKDKQIADLQAEIAELKKQHAAGMGAAELTELKKKLADYEAADKKAAEDKKLAEKKSEFDKLLSEGKAVEAQRAAFMAGDMSEYVKLAEKPKLSTVGGDGNGDKGGDNDKSDAGEQVFKLAEEKAKEAKIPVHEAISLVLRDEKNKDLRARYEKETAVR